MIVPRHRHGTPPAIFVVVVVFQTMFFLVALRLHLYLTGGDDRDVSLTPPRRDVSLGRSDDAAVKVSPDEDGRYFDVFFPYLTHYSPRAKHAPRSTRADTELAKRRREAIKFRDVSAEHLDWPVSSSMLHRLALMIIALLSEEDDDSTRIFYCNFPL